LLNGEPIFLRGVSLHEEALLRPGRAFTPEDARTLLGWAKELGCNYVRLAHYPHNEYMVREAERLGLLVWAEVPVYWSIDWENPNTFANAANQLTEMIARDKNRAAVILWSVANETHASNARLKFLSDLARKTRELDPTRLVTAALFHDAPDGTTIHINDPLGEHLDVLGCNEYWGWYFGNPDLPDLLEWQTRYDKPLIMSEWGGGALSGYHGDALTRWSEEYQEELYKRQIEMFRRIPFLRGLTPWILKDFLSPRRPLPYFQDWYNRKGLVSNRGEKKKAFAVLQAFYKQLAQQ
jgi:beta-glucuronidase